MSKYYKCDLCGTPYAPTNFKQTTAYIETGDKTFSGSPSHVNIWDVCPDCTNKIRDFMDSLKPKEAKNDVHDVNNGKGFLLPEFTLNLYMSSIARSLAVIADKMCEEDEHA